MNIKYKLQAILLISMFFISTVMADVFSKAQHTWPAGVIPYKLDSNIGKINRKAIEDGMKSYNRLTNITFVKVTRRQSIQLSSLCIVSGNGIVKWYRTLQPV